LGFKLPITVNEFLQPPIWQEFGVSYLIIRKFYCRLDGTIQVSYVCVYAQCALLRCLFTITKYIRVLFVSFTAAIARARMARCAGGKKGLFGEGSGFDFQQQNGCKKKLLIF
jgi:hypothetical protein